MRIVTLRCPDCGTIVAGNVLARRRQLRCPGLDCGAVLRFEDLSAADRQYLADNAETLGVE